MASIKIPKRAPKDNLKVSRETLQWAERQRQLEELENDTDDDDTAIVSVAGRSRGDDMGGD